MSIHQNPTYFVPGITSLLESDRVLHKRVAPYLDSFEKGVFFNGGTSVPYFISSAKNPRGLVVGSTGINTIELFEQEKRNEITRLNEAGFSVIWMALPFPKHGQKINTIATNSLRAFITSPQSPVNSINFQGVPKILFTHSSSGRIIYELAHEKETNAALSEFCHYVSISPCFGFGRTTKQYNPFERALLLAFAKRYPNLTPQETIPGQLFLALKASNEDYSDTIKNSLIRNLGALSKKLKPKDDGKLPPCGTRYEGSELTFAQMSEFHERSERLQAIFNANAVNFAPTTIVASPDDKLVCFKTIEDFSKRSGSNLIRVEKAGHYPTKWDPTKFDRVIEDMLSSVSAFEAAAAQKKYTTITPDDFLTYHQRPLQQEPAEIISMADWLSHGPRASLQRAASALNPFARVFQ